MLFRTPVLTPRDADVIAGIHEARASLERKLRIPARWSGLLRRSTLGRVIRGSNSIEGYVIPRDEVVGAAEGETVEANDMTRFATETYRSAMTRVLTLSTDPEFVWSTTAIKDLHYIMMAYDPVKWPGKWREGPIYVVDEAKHNETVYEAPEYSLVKPLMAELVERLNTEESTPDLVRAAMAHLNLVMIHPFKDGNGRMARCVQTLVLGRAGKLEPMFSSIEEYLGTNTRAYYDVLATVGGGKWHPENDATPWVRFCITAHYYQAQTLLRRVRESGALMDQLEDLVRAAKLPDRTQLGLWDAALGFKVRNGTYRKAADISAQAASRDLNALVEAGFLVPQGEKKGRHYVATSVVRDAWMRVREDRRIPDPYEEPKNFGVPSSTTLPTSAPVFSGSTATPSTGPRPPSER